MAAMLIEIKSRMLLPPKRGGRRREPEDPRAELVRRLLEYEQMKLAAARLNALPQLGRDVLRAQVYIEQSLQPRFPDVHVVTCSQAWRDILQRARLNQHHTHHPRAAVGARAHEHRAAPPAGPALRGIPRPVRHPRGVPVLVVTFIALLELAAAERLLEVTQAEAFAPIYVRLAYVRPPGPGPLAVAARPGAR
jgi:segregation and condensation protein A